MPDREETIKLLKAIQKDIRLHGSKNYYLLLSVCHFINRLYCNCKYVEYWIFDMNFGEHECKTELGFELKGIDTIDKFVDFLETKKHDNGNESS